MVILSTSRNTVQNNNSPAQTSQLDSQITSLTAVNLPTCVTKPKNSIPPTQTVEQVLGFTPAEICRTEKEPKLTIKQLLSLSSCKGYVQTPLQTLNGIYVNQASQFLPLAQEAKKLAEALNKEQDTSPWAGIPPKKLLQDSFVKQLNSIQALEQLAPLHTAREHLPKDTVEILELLEKVDNIPFNQLYNLVQDCADCYYTKVIKILTDLLKCNFTDRQTVLVNTARALKFLESYRDRQAKLWKIFTKYDKLPDHFHDLQNTLQTEFALLKKATSKNIEQFLDTIKPQQMYTTSLCNHVNTIYAKLVQLEKQIQTHCLHPHSQTDSVQINAPEYNSDIDSQIDVLPDLQSHAENNQEEPTPDTDDLKTPTFHKIPIGLTLCLNQFRILQNTHRIKMLNPSWNNTKTDKDPN